MSDKPTEQELRAARQRVKDMIATLEAKEPTGQEREEWEQTLFEAYEQGAMLSILLVERGLDELEALFTRLNDASHGNR